MPMRNLLSILGATALGVWAYFGVIERLNNIETQGKLMLSDVEKNTPVAKDDNDFYTHMKKEQEILNISMKESLKQKEERK